MHIETYHQDNFTGVDELWRQVFPDDPPWNRATIAIPAKLAVQPELFLVARTEQRVIGTVMGGYDGHRGWIYALAVAPTERRKGTAAALMTEIERRLRKAGCGKINLQVRATNTTVISFYKGIGYDVEERISMGKRLE